MDNPCSGGGCFHGFVASQSKTDNFKAVSASSATFCLTMQKQFSDGNSISPDLLGWGMTVTDPLNVNNHYTTDTSSGRYYSMSTALRILHSDRGLLFPNYSNNYSDAELPKWLSRPG